MSTFSILRHHATEAIIRCLKDEDGYVRLAAVRSLGSIKDPLSIDPLGIALMDKEDYVRWNVAEALGKIGDTRSIAPLMSSLADDNNLVQKEVVKALKTITDQDIGIDSAKWQEWWANNKKQNRKDARNDK